jgi:hypothetical protein
MENFKFASIEVKRGYDARFDLVSLRLENDRIPWDAPRPEGLNSVWFCFTAEEFYRVMRESTGTCSDIGHNVRRSGECFTFFDLDFSAQRQGIMHVPFVNVQISYQVCAILARAVRLAFRRVNSPGDSVKIDIPLPLRERWAREYGRGKGSADLDMTPETAAFLAECESAPAPDEEWRTVRSNVDRLIQIAKNNTYRRADRARVRLAKDWDGFYFRIVRPDGSTVLNGGLVNHTRDGGSPSWSTHT